jgi:hypothetical protein
MRRVFLCLAAVLAALSINSAFALPRVPDPDDPPPPTPSIAMPDCVTRATTTLSATLVSYVGQQSTLHWDFQPFGTCPRGYEVSLTLAGQGVAFNGDKNVTNMVTTTYAVIASVTAGDYPVGDRVLASTRVVVPSPPSTVTITGNTVEWARYLALAVTQPNETVKLADDLDLDMDTLSFIHVASNVKVLGNRDANTFGPRLFTQQRPKPLFVFDGDNIHFSGFRLQGPHWDPVFGEDNLETGIYVGGIHEEIDNMELSGWAGAAIRVADDLPTHRQALEGVQGVRIHDNFFHHNQHYDGFGYGVDMGDGGNALIERNVFDFNRHAITSGGAPLTSYSAVQNLILKGGGIHSSGTVAGHTHILDVHGDDSCFGIDANCGNAGDTFFYVDNAVQYVHDSAIKIRGTPRNGVWINHNVFAHDSIGGASDSIYDEAVKYNWDPNRPDSLGRLHIGSGGDANTVGLDSFGQYGVCDFDGDGRDDLFLGTGVTWWYMSGAKRQWVYLNAFPERASQVGLGDFDGDGRCDVFAVHGTQWDYSPSGTSSWHNLGNFAIPFDQLRFGHFRDKVRTDIFRRAPNGQWSLISSPVSPITVKDGLLSPVALSDLRFGDFNNNGLTDVIAIVGGSVMVSWEGQTAFQPLNGLVDSLARTMVVDLDGNGQADVIRFTPFSAQLPQVAPRLDVSWGGRTAFQPLFTSLPLTDNLRFYVGAFDDKPGGDLVLLDPSRYGKVFDPATRQFVGYSIYAY